MLLLFHKIHHHLTLYNPEMQQNMRFLLQRYAKQNWHKLPKEEQRANRIDITVP